MSLNLNLPIQKNHQKNGQQRRWVGAIATWSICSLGLLVEGTLGAPEARAELESGPTLTTMSIAAVARAAAPLKLMAQERTIAQVPVAATSRVAQHFEGGDRSPADEVCYPTEPTAATLMHQMTQNTAHLVNWIERPDNSFQQVLSRWGPQLVAHLTAQPWPMISDRARLARVPILMYHDILSPKEVFFDVTPAEFERHLQLIQENGLTPISMDQLMQHLRIGAPLPPKPILLTFDDGYLGHYEHVFPLLQKYGYPGTFSIYTYKVGRDHGRPGVNWAQLKEMAADPLVTIAAHSVNHPRDLRDLDDVALEEEVKASKRILEEQLGTSIRYFTYPEGNYDARVAGAVENAGFVAALAMDNAEDRFVGESPHMLALDRMGQSQIERAIAEAWGGFPLPTLGAGFNFSTPIYKAEHDLEDLNLTLITGGQPVTVHADSRYAVEEIIEGTDVAAAVDGGFFSLKYLDSNVMVGPVLSRSTGEFVPGNPGEIPLLVGRPLVMISDDAVDFVPFDPVQHNTLEGIQAEMANVQDAFIAAAWLVKDGEGRRPNSFGSLFDFDANRHRAFWGINQAGQPTIGITHTRIDSVSLGNALAELGLRDAVMLDSGGSTAMAYGSESLVKKYIPRPVPHVVGLVPTATAQASQPELSAVCAIARHQPQSAKN